MQYPWIWSWLIKQTSFRNSCLKNEFDSSYTFWIQNLPIENDCLERLRPIVRRRAANVKINFVYYNKIGGGQFLAVYIRTGCTRKISIGRFNKLVIINLISHSLPGRAVFESERIPPARERTILRRCECS